METVAEVLQCLLVEDIGEPSLQPSAAAPRRMFIVLGPRSGNQAPIGMSISNWGSSLGSTV